MENLYVHSVVNREIPVTMKSEGFHCENLRSIIEANFSRDELVKLNVTMESPNGTLDVLQRSFNTIATPIKKYLHEIVSKNDKFEKDILESKGDISKVKRIDTTLKLLKVLAKDKHNSTVSRRAGQLLRLYDNVLSMKASFMLGYQRKGSLTGSFVWGTYVIYVTYIVVCTSHLCAMHAGVMKNESYAIKNLDEQIKAFYDGSIQKWCDFFLKKKQNDFVKEEAALVITVVLLGTIITAALFLRVLVFYFYYTRMQLSDYFNQQSDYFNLHASEIRKSGMDSAQKDAVLKAQKTWADRFAMLSDAIVVDDLKASRKTVDMVKVANKEVNPSKIDVPNVGMDFI